MSESSCLSPKSQNSHNTITYRSIEFCEEKSPEIVQLRLELKYKDSEIIQRNQIIKKLQERCVMIGEYQQKIKKLEWKASQLERIIERLQKGNIPSIQDIVRESANFGQKAEQQNKSKGSIRFESFNKNFNKQNQKNNNKTEPSPSKFGQKQRLSIRAQNIEEIVSSKFLNPAPQSNISKEVDIKFNQIKSQIQNKQPKSNKNIEQIISIINSNKIKREDLVIKEINNKLQTILNESSRINTSFKQKQMQINVFPREKTRSSWLSEKENIYQNPNFKKHKRSETFSSILNSSSTSNHSILNQKPQKSMKLDLKSVVFENQNSYSRKQRLANIMKSTNIDQLLKSRKQNSVNLISISTKNSKISTYSALMTERTHLPKKYWD